MMHHEAHEAGPLAIFASLADLAVNRIGIQPGSTAKAAKPAKLRGLASCASW